MQLNSHLSEDAILHELGSRLAQKRLAMQWPQAELADRAGVSKRTVERIEAGASTQLSNWIRVLRALELVELLDGLLPATGPRPMDLLKLKKQQRRRASSKRGAEKGPWAWGEDS